MAEIKVAVRIDSIPVKLPKALQLAAQCGATAVELCARTAVRPSDLSDTGMRQLRKMLDDLNLRVAALRFPTRRGYDNPRDLEQRVDATKAAMRLAYQLGANVVVNQIGTIPESEEDTGYQTLKAVINDLGRYGARVGAFFAAETGSESGERLAELLDESEEAFVAAALNPGQLIVNRHSPADAISALKERILVVNAVDGVIDLAAGRGISVPLGQGTADFPELLGRLEDFQYRGYFVVGRREMAKESVLEELQQGVEYLRSL
ncbi:sugar phosphate isomerase/epimerase family protein [Novipirellula artificiosorum]|uniref:Xylose isomerase-like TIM barrel n=1 Tax=Novipirellula artificiosorum TaxID=2528016 RepID=A0A5C6D9N3_9BACT|nr:sugar phosphate isomerase/epimerase family protein [Novipirellula artificiosorum]TWU31569.1 Xylose isomerase-like TIM barrel [Novipirellula artificiosorum]